MEQRREPRLIAEQSLAVTVLGGNEVRCMGTVKNASGRGLGLELPVAAAPGTALKIELSDSLLLGEVVFCRAAENAYFVGVELQQALYGLADLARAVSELREEKRLEPSRAG